MSGRRRTAGVVLALLLVCVGAGCGSATTLAPPAETIASPRPVEAFELSIAADRSSAEIPVLFAEAAKTAPQAPQPRAAAAEEAGQSPEAATRAVPDAPGTGTFLIYEAQVNLAVHEVRDRMEKVVSIADESEGFLQSQDDTTVIIRVPATRFREALTKIEALGDVLHRRVSAQDVSDQLRDVRIRLRNAIEMRDRLAELLSRAQTVPDSLTIEQELDRLTQQIEQMRGQLQSLEDRVAFSTITVQFQAVQENQEVPRELFRLPFPWLEELGLVNLLRL